VVDTVIAGATEGSSMSTNVHYTQISDPQLLDIVDEAWLRDKLPDDSKCHWFVFDQQANAV
jgi:hypothetical protein